jgi:hypothetical protein
MGKTLPAETLAQQMPVCRKTLENKDMGEKSP